MGSSPLQDSIWAPCIELVAGGKVVFKRKSQINILCEGLEKNRLSTNLDFVVRGAFQGVQGLWVVQMHHYA